MQITTKRTIERKPALVLVVKAACLALALYSTLNATPQAAVKRTNSADRSFSVAVPEKWRAADNAEGPVVSLAQIISGEAVIRREVPPFDPAAMARETVRALGYVESCSGRTDYTGGRQERWSPLLISTISLRQDWPAAHAVTGGCSIFELPAIFFSSDGAYYTARCRFSDLKTCGELAASVGPPVAEAEEAVPATKFEVLGLEGTLPSGACGTLNGFAKGLERWLTLLIYTIAGIPLVVFFYVFSILFYQSVAAGGLIALLAGWLTARRPKARLILLSVAVLAGLFFSWNSANVPQFGLRSNPHGEVCAAVTEGWLSSALVILAGCLGFFARRRYEGRTR